MFSNTFAQIIANNGNVYWENTMYKTLMKLISKLKERQSWCPYCGGECAHSDSECILRGLWFDDDPDPDDDD